MSTDRHLSDDQRRALFEELDATVREAIAPALERYGPDACPHCLTRIVGVALGSLAAWHVASSAHGIVEREQLVATFLAYVTASVRRQLEAMDATQRATTTVDGTRERTH